MQGTEKAMRLLAGSCSESNPWVSPATQTSLMLLIPLEWAAQGGSSRQGGSCELCFVPQVPLSLCSRGTAPSPPFPLPAVFPVLPQLFLPQFPPQPIPSPTEQGWAHSEGFPKKKKKPFSERKSLVVFFLGGCFCCLSSISWMLL